MNTLMSQAREALTHRQRSLRAMLRGNGAGMELLRGHREPDVLDTAVEVTAETVLERLSEQERRELRDIDEALRRIEAGHFGHCARCGGAIGRQRLRAIPEARHCIACSTAVGR
jgi:DnaK suppressor protein